MKKVQRDEVLSIGDYETIRDRFRTRVISEKRARRLVVGESMSVLFENHDTVLLQIQEMLRTERITREASVLHEMETYNELVPAANELSATVFLEVDDPDERSRFLKALLGLERSVAIEVEGRRFGATWDPARLHSDHASAVNYFKFPLDAPAVHVIRAAAQSRSDAPSVAFLVDHPHYTRRVPFSLPTLLSLAQDFDD